MHPLFTSFSKILYNLKNEKAVNSTLIENKEILALSKDDYLAVSGGPEVENEPDH